MSRKFVGVIDARRLSGQRRLMMMIQRHKIITATEPGALSMRSGFSLAPPVVDLKLLLRLRSRSLAIQTAGGDDYGEFEQSFRAAADE